MRASQATATPQQPAPLPAPLAWATQLPHARASAGRVGHARAREQARHRPHCSSLRCQPEPPAARANAPGPAPAVLETREHAGEPDASHTAAARASLSRRQGAQSRRYP
jgi:hypothetical protein